ncbi:MAG: cytochrome c oxidase assembly protein [Gemmatimonadota bacterium]|nr:cytochrome c oxidase assembly protein [Gemmatimonadota bacterium]
MIAHASSLTLLGALLHPLEQGDWLSGLSIHPSTVAGILALGGIYAWRARQLKRAESGYRTSKIASEEGGTSERPRSPTTGQRLAFITGLAMLFLSLNGPIHDLSDTYLFSVHMVQHLLLTMAVVPLLIAGTPGEMLRPVLRSHPVAAVARVATTGPACFLAFNLTIAVWHVPAVYDLAMRSHPMHIIQHLCFLVAATLMWWPIMSPLPELPRLSYPKQMLYTFLLTLPMALIGIVITYAERVLYPAYQSAPRIWGLSPLEDQLLGGLIMWLPGGLVLLGVLSVIFFRWASRENDDTASAQADWRPA